MSVYEAVLIMAQEPAQEHQDRAWRDANPEAASHPELEVML
ncbi:hypothetical protein [Variovorax sp. KK3]|nr:hypothetical protein [Variovorax sp. KK3]